MDILYNAITRPVSNEVEKKGGYYVDPAQKDGRSKKIKEDDPRSNQQNARQHKKADAKLEDSELEQNLEPDKEGKGLYEDESGQKRLDIYA